MSIPKKYSYIADTDAPSLIRQAARLYGVKEKAGAANNPAILAWAKEIEEALGVKLGYNADSIPWCGLFAGVVAVRAGWKDQMTKAPLWARNWNTFGQKSPKPSFGDILVFTRNGGGHVGFYVAEDSTCYHEDSACYHVLGGNQGDAVSIIRVEKSRLLGARRPQWRIAEPVSVRPIRMLATGKISTNEA